MLLEKFMKNVHDYCLFMLIMLACTCGTRIHTHNESIAIIMYSGTGQQGKSRWEFAQYAHNSAKQYAEKWGYDFLFYTQPIKGLDRTEHWMKVALLQNALKTNKYSWCLFLDDDIVITNPNIQLQELIQSNSGADIIMAYDSAHFFESEKNKYFMNTGAILVKNTAWSLDYLARLWKHGSGRFSWKPTYDQDAVYDLYKKVEKDQKHIALVKPPLLQSFIAWRSNKCPLWKPGNFCLHLAGFSWNDKVLAMKEVYTNPSIISPLLREIIVRINP